MLPIFLHTLLIHSVNFFVKTTFRIGFVFTSSPCPSCTLLIKALRVAVIEPLDVVHPLLVIIEVPVIPTGILGDLFASFVLQVLLSTSIRSASASLFKHEKSPL